MTFLEQSVAGWFSYKGFFVRTNIKFGRRPAGGYTGEIDVAAFDPKTGNLIHIETSTDADSWAERKRRFNRKFSDAERHYKDIFDFKFRDVKRLAIVGFSRKLSAQVDFGNRIEVVLVPQFMQEIA